MSNRTRLNFEFLNEPIVKKFLDISINEKIFDKAVNEPTLENQNILDEHFKTFYKKARILRYLSTLIKVHSVDFDKRNRKIQKRFLLTLDGPLTNEEDVKLSRKDAIPDETESGKFTNKCSSLGDCITDSNLYKAYVRLNAKQKEILNLVYIDCLSFQEVATYLGDSRQNVFNIYKRSLNKLKQEVS